MSNWQTKLWAQIFLRLLDQSDGNPESQVNTMQLWGKSELLPYIFSWNFWTSIVFKMRFLNVPINCFCRVWGERIRCYHHDSILIFVFTVTSHTCKTYSINSAIFKFLWAEVINYGTQESLEEISSAFKFKPKVKLKRKRTIWLNLRSHIYIVWAEGANRLWY